MAKEILINIINPNIDALDKSLKTALTTAVCYGLKIDFSGTYLVMADDATAQQIGQAQAIAAAHDPAVKTAEQVAEIAGRTDIADLLTKADTALTQIAAKRATFAATPNLVNATPLLLEIADDTMAMIKVLKYIAKRVG